MGRDIRVETSGNPEAARSALADVSIAKHLYSFAVVAKVGEIRGSVILQRTAGYVVAPDRESAEQAARMTAVKKWPDALQRDAFVEEIPDRVVIWTADHIKASAS